jgi:NAD(P)-dependent dehydrogenase (short-subunit alcohol dehydrogenase family)
MRFENQNAIVTGAKRGIGHAIALRLAAEVLRRIQRLKELSENVGRNIQEALAFEVAFLEVFTCSK